LGRTEGAKPSPPAKRDELDNRDCEVAVDVIALWEIGYVAEPCSTPRKRAGLGAQDVAIAFSRVLLPAPLGLTMAVIDRGGNDPVTPFDRDRRPVGNGDVTERNVGRLSPCNGKIRGVPGIEATGQGGTR
jgi:hypothetical protein